MTGLITVILIFSLPIIKVITNHVEKQTQARNDIVKNELELEKLKHANFLMETEKMRLELQKEQLQYDLPKTETVFTSIKRD
ncbi:hypothetical protein [Heyndrickxia acidicola]|uniref:Cell division protein FtsL n=1 Tax=Heyndrickxia acidicola TaxID=209389 RepID=A0ABU6MLG6_9BACI|nr:hypothetical protein [Heyndrickxia acidicola]MED1204077.1 hypothetical protein [Heyndrickxia acidicola]